MCDVTSVDGNHNAASVGRDLEAAQRMSPRPGALLLLDDMVTHRDDLGRSGVERAVQDGLLTGLHCAPDGVVVLPRAHRFASSGDAKYVAHAWCHARFATQRAGGKGEGKGKASEKASATEAAPDVAKMSKDERKRLREQLAMMSDGE